MPSSRPLFTIVTGYYLSQRLGRPVNPTVYTRDELQRRRQAGSSFVTRVLQQPRQWLIGDEDDLAA